MKHIKTYENTIEDRLPQVGDYVVCHEKGRETKLNQFISTNPGQIIKIISKKNKMNIYLVIYEVNIPNNIKSYFNDISDISDLYDNKILNLKGNTRGFYMNEILHFSPTKDDIDFYIEIYLSANKYNL